MALKIGNLRAHAPGRPSHGLEASRNGPWLPSHLIPDSGWRQRTSNSPKARLFDRDG